MIKKTIALFAVLAFASFSSFALAGGNCGEKNKEKDCDREKSEASASSFFEVGCGDDKDEDKS